MRGTVVIAAGGTGGHFFPAEALAAALGKKGYDVVLFTERRTGRKESGAFATAEQHVFDIKGVVGRGAAARMLSISLIVRAGIRARRLIRNIRPAAVFGFGGYSCVPAMLACLSMPKRERPRLILHEGNAILGRANRLLARRVDIVATSYETVAGLPRTASTVLTGFPVRADIENRAASPFPPLDGDLNILVWGGSLGARVLADVVPAALAALPDGLRRRLRVVQQARAEDLDRVRSEYARAGIRAETSTFLSGVGEHLQNSHLVIGRAGGSSVAEVAMVGRPAILVPLPIAASDEQFHNAERVSGAGAGWTMRQADLDQAALTTLVSRLLGDPDELARAAGRMSALRRRHAATALAELADRHAEPVV
ncbi:MAG: undecaprenyldiphospho-muramoylpentapeptide beta-N-acetylglucosaminyltransferase [Gluconacetobacter diazotrophicus]|nr:undecaprenyldiphospho-muramoylpentapeptide beta-N-acetylglucosaminyltransferase [Gluconacetobacter diazotrophicus]